MEKYLGVVIMSFQCTFSQALCPRRSGRLLRGGGQLGKLSWGTWGQGSSEEGSMGA